ncbi:MAG: glycosyltransferase family 2 protein [Nitrososphaerota archaeon]
MIKVSIIIPTFNRKNFLKKALDSCLAQKMRKNEFEVIVIDNGSRDGTREYLQKLMRRQKNIKVVFLPKNRGAAAARNIGAKVARGMYLVLLDDDSFFKSDLELEKIWQKFTSLPDDIKVLAFRVENDFKDKWNEREKLVHTFVGAGAAIERDILKSIPFDEDFFIYGEEDDLSYRILLSGYKILYTPSIQVKHITNSKKKGKKALFLFTRNWTWLPFKYYPLPIAIMASLVNVVCIFIGSLRKKVSSLPVILGAISAIFHLQKVLAKKQSLNKKTIDMLLKITPKNNVFKIGLLKILKIFSAS